MHHTPHTTRAYISLGSNMGDSETLLANACTAISETKGLTLVAASATYYTEPQGIINQSWFYNQVIAVDCIVNQEDIPPQALGVDTTSWTAQTLLQFLLDTEKTLGRKRGTNPALRFGPRCIDLDLLLFGQEKSTDPTCILPHPRLWQRAFVLIPLRQMLQQATLDTQEQNLLHACEAALATLSYSVENNKIYQTL